MSELIDFDGELWPEPYAVDGGVLRQATSEEMFLRDSFELLKEAIILTGIASSVRMPGDRVGLERNQAVIVGHMTRMIKLMRTALYLCNTYRDGEQLMVLSRQFIDSASTIVFILESGPESPRFEGYINDSLISENEFLKTVAKQIEGRGGVILPIEERIRRSIAESFGLAGVQADALPGRDRRAWPPAEQRIALLGPTAYVAYRMGSNSIHGGWSDIEKNHLDTVPGGGFAPNHDTTDARPQPLLMMSLVSLAVVRVYLRNYMDLAMADFDGRLIDLDSRVRLVDSAHEDFIARSAD